MTDERLRRAERAAAGDDEAALQRAIAERRRGGRPTTELLARTARWRALADAAVTWTGRPLADGDGHEAEAIAGAEAKVGPLPLAVREWWELCGRRRDLIGDRFEDQPQGPDRARALDGLVALYVHSAGLCVWAARLADAAEDDPQAWVTPAVRGKWKALEALACGAPISEAVTALALRRIVASIVGPRVRLEPALLGAAQATLPELARLPVITAASGGVAAPFVVHGADGLLLSVEPGGARPLLVAASAEARARALGLVPGLVWETPE